MIIRIYVLCQETESFTFYMLDRKMIVVTYYMFCILIACREVLCGIEAVEHYFFVFSLQNIPVSDFYKQ